MADDEAIIGVELSANGEAVLNLIREIGSVSEQEMNKVAKGAGYASGFTQPHMTNEQKASADAWMKAQARQLQGLYRSNLTESGDRLKRGGPARLNVAGRETAEGMMKLFGGAGGFFGLNPADIKDLRKTFEKFVNSTNDEGNKIFSTSARANLKSGFRTMLDEASKSPLGVSGKSAVETTQQMAAEIYTTLKLIMQSPQLLGMLRNVSQAKLDVGTTTAQEQLFSPEGSAFYELRQQAARSRRLVSNGTEAGGLNRLTPGDLNQLGGNKATTKIYSNLVQAESILQSLGQTIGNVDVKNVSLIESMKILEEAQGQLRAEMLKGKAAAEPPGLSALGAQKNTGSITSNLIRAEAILQGLGQTMGDVDADTISLVDSLNILKAAQEQLKVVTSASVDVNKLAGNKADTMVLNNVVKALAIFQSLGQEMGDVDVSTISFLDSLKLLQSAQEQLNAIVRPPKPPKPTPPVPTFAEKAGTEAQTMVGSNISHAAALYAGMGSAGAAYLKNLEALDAESLTLAQSMKILNDAEAEQAALIRAAKTQQLGPGSRWQRFFHSTRHYGPTSTNVAAEEQTFGQFGARHAANTLGYLIPGIAFGMGIEELMKTVEEATEAQRALAEVQAEFQALGQQSQLAGYDQAIQNISSNTGVAVDQTAEFALQLKGVFGSTGQAEQALQALDMGIQATGESGEELLGQLTAISQAFNALRTAGASSFTTIQNQGLHFQDIFGVPAAQIYEGTAAIGPIAQQLGLSDKYTQAIVAATVQKTGESGEAVGDALQRILPGFTTNVGQVVQQLIPLGAKAQPVLSAFNRGQEGVAFQQFLQLLPHISAALGNQIITDLGGNASSRGLLISLGQATSGAEFEKKLNSAVPPDRLNTAFNDIMKTLSGSMTRLSTTIDNLGVSLIDSGIGRTFVDIVDYGTDLIQWLKDLNQDTDGLVSTVLEAAAAMTALKVATGVVKGVGTSISVLKGGGPLVSGATKASDILVEGAQKAADALAAGGEKGGEAEAAGGEKGGAANTGEGLLGGLAGGGLLSKVLPDALGAALWVGLPVLFTNSYLQNYTKSHPHSTATKVIDQFSDQSIEHDLAWVFSPKGGLVKSLNHFFDSWFNGNLFAPKPKKTVSAAEDYEAYASVQETLTKLLGNAGIPYGNVFFTHQLSNAQISKMDAVYGPKITSTLQEMLSDFKSGQFKVVATLQNQINSTTSASQRARDVGDAADAAGKALGNLLHHGASATQLGGISLTGPVNAGKLQGFDFTGAQTAYQEGDVSFATLLKAAQQQETTARIQYNAAVRNPNGSGVPNQLSENLITAITDIQQLFDTVQQERVGLAGSLLQPGSPAASQAGESFYAAAATNTSSRSQQQQFWEEVISMGQQYVQNRAAGATSTAQANAINAAGTTLSASISQGILQSFAQDFDKRNKKGKIISQGTAADVAAYLNAAQPGTVVDGRIHVPGQAVQAPQKIQAATEVTQAMMQVAIAQAWANPIQQLQQTEMYTKELMQEYLSKGGKATDPQYLQYKAQMAQSQGQGAFQSTQSVEQAALAVQTAQAWAQPLKAVQETTAATEALLAYTEKLPGVGPNSLPVLQLKATLSQQPQAAWQATSAALQAKGAQQTAAAFEDPFKEAQVTAANTLQQMLAYLKEPGTSKTDTTYRNLQAQYVTAEHQKFDAAKQIEEAKNSYLAQVFSNDPIKSAEESIAAANVAVTAAHGKAAYWQAMQQKAQAIQQKFQAQTDVLTAQGQVQEALANVAGQPYQQAMAQQANSLALYNQRIQQDTQYAKSLGWTTQQTTAYIKNDTTATTDWANYLNSKANSMQALVSQDENVLEAELTLGTVTVTQAISQLWADYYKVKSNQQEALAVLTEIRQLQNSAGQNLSFNLPTTIVPTTLYQARLAEATGGGAAMVNGNVTINMNFPNSNGSSASAAAARVAKVFGYTGNVTGPRGPLT